jgi:hypothetical protein
MASKRPSKKTAVKNTANQTFNLDSFLSTESLSSEPKDKELTWIPLSKAWHDAIKLPGFPRGYVSLVRGYSNTGKSTAFYEAIAGAQAIGDLPIVIETEGNWNWEHARQVGVKFIEMVDETTGEITHKPDGFILVRGKDLYNKYKLYDHKESKMGKTPTRSEPVIEDVALFMSEMLDKQSDGTLPKNLCFLWDSIGTLNCYKSATSNSSNNMWNAGAMGAFQALVNFKIPSSRDIDSPYINTFISVQKIWLDSMNGVVIRHRGGDFMFYNSRLIVHLGGILTHGTKKLKAAALGQNFQFGTKAEIRCEKNHITGIERKGMIASTPHGYINPDEEAEYKAKHRAFIHAAMNVPYDAEVMYSEEEAVLGVEDLKG